MSRPPLALMLYPRAYRRSYGDEIAAHFAESTTGASRAWRWYEAADLAGHAVRMRLRLTSAGPAGRVLAAAAPYAAVGSAVYAALAFAQLVMRVMVHALPDGPDAFTLGMLASADLALVAAGGATLAGRWRAARVLTVLGTAALAVQQALGDTYVLDGAGRMLSAVLALVMVLGCPPDTPPAGRTVRRGAAVYAAAAFLPLFGLLVTRSALLFLSLHWSVLPVLALAAALVITGPRAQSPGSHAAGTALAALPWLTYNFQVLHWELDAVGLCLAVLAAGAFLAWARGWLGRQKAAARGR